MEGSLESDMVGESASMTDAELSSKVLRYFYDNRFRGMMDVRCTDIDVALGAIEFCRICKQLKDLGLIENHEAALSGPTAKYDRKRRDDAGQGLADPGAPVGSN